MNYLHPQLFFPISLFFFLLRPLVRGEGVFGPDSRGENLTVNSTVRWSCRRHHRHHHRHHHLCPNISLPPPSHPLFIPSSHPLLLSLSVREVESSEDCDVLVYGLQFLSQSSHRKSCTASHL